MTDSQPTKTVLCRELQDHACVCSGYVIDLADILTFSTFSYSLVIVNVPTMELELCFKKI